MAASTVIKNFRDGTVKLFSGDSPAVTYTVSLEAGDFSISGLTQSGKELTTYMDRGELASVRHTTRTFPSGSFTAHFADLTDASDQTMTDFLMKSGSFNANTSTLPGEVYCVKIQIDIEGTDHGDSADHQITLDDCACTVDFSEGDPSSLSVSFQCLGAITMV